MKLKDNSTHDTLDRKQVAENYVSLLKAIDGSYVIALDAPWGSGKTTLLKYIEENLDKEDIAFVNYNAWENDYTEEPFLSLISEFNTQIKDKKYLPSLAKFNSLKKVSYKVSKKVVPSVIKDVTQFFIGTDAVKDIESGAKEIIESVISDIRSNTVDDIFDTIETSKQSRKKFKEELIKITAAIIDKKEQKKFVFIIDELDRCKPTFAIELLENIKHLFDVENVIFLISVDKVQLSESIKSVYGSGFDSLGYLKRFFNFDLHLKFNEDTYFLEEKVESILSKDINSIGGKLLVLEAFSVLKLSLRDFEQILVEIRLLFLMSKINNHKLYFVLLCLKYKHNDSYAYLKNNKEISINDFNRKALDTYDNEYFRFFKNVWTPTDKANEPMSDDIKNAIYMIESTLR